MLKTAERYYHRGKDLLDMHKQDSLLNTYYGHYAMHENFSGRMKSSVEYAAAVGREQMLGIDAKLTMAVSYIHLGNFSEVIEIAAIIAA